MICDLVVQPITSIVTVGLPKADGTCRVHRNAPKRTTPSSKGIGTTLYDGGPSGGGLPECCFLIRWREGGLLFAVRLIIDVARAGVRIAPRNRTKRARAGNQQTPPNAVVRSSPQCKVTRTSIGAAGGEGPQWVVS